MLDSPPWTSTSASRSCFSPFQSPCSKHKPASGGTTRAAASFRAGDEGRCPCKGRSCIRVLRTRLPVCFQFLWPREGDLTGANSDIDSVIPSVSPFRCARSRDLPEHCPVRQSAPSRVVEVEDPADELAGRV